MRSPELRSSRLAAGAATAVAMSAVLVLVPAGGLSYLLATALITVGAFRFGPRPAAMVAAMTAALVALASSQGEGRPAPWPLLLGFLAADLVLCAYLERRGIDRGVGDRFAAVLEAMPQLAFVARDSGMLEYVNDHWREFTGHDLRSVRELGWGGLVHPDDRANARLEWTRTVAAGMPGQGELRYRSRDGGYRWFLVSIAPLDLGVGGTRRWIGTMADLDERKLAESELRHSAELLDFGDPFHEVDRGWRVVAMNARFETLTRTPRERALGRRIWELWPDLAHPGSPYWREYQRCMRVRTPVQFDAYYEPLGLWTGVTAYPTSSGGIAIFIRDIGDRKRAEEALRTSEARARAILASLVEGVFVQDTKGRMELVNDAARQVFGVDAGFCEEGERPGLRMVRADGTPLPHRECPGVIALETGARVRDFEVRYQHPDGTARWLTINAQPVRDGDADVHEVVGTCFDITDRKCAEEALREADRRKNDFLALLSHELRNPLAPLSNSLYVLERTEPGGAQAQRALLVLHRQLNQLSRLVDDLLDVTRITRGKIRLQTQPLDLSELARRTTEDHRALFGAAGVGLRVDTPEEPVVVQADPARIAQVIGNLLQNAAKFTPRGGEVEVVVEARVGIAAVRLKDTGVGIAPELVGTLFQPFVQVDQTLDRSRGGLGLGLALVKGIVELHGGSVSVASAGIGTGAEFTIELPRREAAELPAGRPDAPAVHAPFSVLVIEDNADAADSLKEALELNGHRVDVATSGPDGLELARARRPDLVICDIGLPGMSGFEVAASFRRDTDLRCVPLVALSGYAAPEDVERARSAGFDRHVAKPIDMTVLERELFGLHRSPDARAGGLP